MPSQGDEAHGEGDASFAGPFHAIRTYLRYCTYVLPAPPATAYTAYYASLTLTYAYHIAIVLHIDRALSPPAAAACWPGAHRPRSRTYLHYTNAAISLLVPLRRLSGINKLR